MHSLGVAGFIYALTVVHAVVAAYCVAGFVRRREAEVLVFGLLNAALVALDFAYGWLSSGADGAETAIAVVRAAAIAAAVFLVHYALVYTRARRPRWVVGALYALGAFFEVGNLLGGLVRPGSPVARQAYVFGFEISDFATRASLLGFAASLVWLGLIAAALGSIARAFARGRREGPALAGTVALAGTALHDAARWQGWVSGPMLAPFGYFVFVGGVLMTLFARFSALRAQLEVRAGKLADRSRALARAYEELRAAQDELVRKEQLAVVGELSAVIAHEVRNPLAIIGNAVATLRRSEILPADRETLLGILDEESSRLNRLVGDLLRYARPIDVQRQLVSVREIVERAVVLVEGARGVSAEIVEPAPAPKIWGDAHLLRQVVENLITNAVQAMAAGGALTLTLAPADVDGGPGVELRIQDTGEGMDTQVRRRALDPFFTTRPAGTGLGLAIVARIVDAHGGRLEIASAAGVGTEVRVFLPVSVEPTRSARERELLKMKERRSAYPPMPVELRRAMVGGDEGLPDSSRGAME